MLEVRDEVQHAMRTAGTVGVCVRVGTWLGLDAHVAGRVFVRGGGWLWV